MVKVQTKKSNSSKVFALISTFGLVIIVAIVAIVFAKGYRIDGQNLNLQPSGLLVVKSEPDGAQVFINGQIKGVTDESFSLIPDTYDVSVTKDGYTTWSKRIRVEKEEVTEITANLFKTAPSLSAITLNGAINPVPTTDFTKIAYAVPYEPQANGDDKSGLWVMETLDLPLGFAREPRRITDGDLTGASWIWSPDEREILLTIGLGNYLLDANAFTPQNQRVNLGTQAADVLVDWQEEFEEKQQARRRSLPEQVNFMFDRAADQIVFSPDEEMVLYTASASANLESDLISPLPGESTQKEERQITPSHTYIYDIKEDRNYLIDDNSSDLQITGAQVDPQYTRRLVWFPTSRHVVLAKDGSIVIMDYDGTNRQSVYSGSFVAPHVFPTLGTDRILVLTTLGASESPANLYSVTIK